MSRFLVRRCSMSSIEEEDEPSTPDELIVLPERLSSLGLQKYQELHHSSSLLEWDSELSESDQDFDDNDDDAKENGEEKAANRALENFRKTCSRTREIQKNPRNDFYTSSSIHIYDEDDSAELDAIISELRDFKIQFEERPSLSQTMAHKMQQSINYSCPPPSSSSTTSSSFMSNTNGCVYELRTLEDQLEAALASLTLTINDYTVADFDSQQQRSSGSSACSSGIGDEIGNDSLSLSNTPNIHHQPTTTNRSHTSKLATFNSTDDCDSAFSDSGSTDKVTLINHDEFINSRSMITMTSTTDQTASTIHEKNDPILSNSQHPSKLLVRTYNDDGSTKSILIEESMTIRDVLFVLVHKNHREPDNDYALVEVLPDLHMERTFEDHQKLAEAILMWPSVSSNRLIFTKRPEKYALFRTTSSVVIKDDTIIMYDELLKTPDTDGVIYLKEKSRKSWKKHFCVLRSSGLYFVPKGKSKKDLVCLAKFENVELFFGLGWKKKFKSPTDYCFALKHPLIQKKSSKYIKYMCVDSKIEFDRWITSIRIAKFGQQLKINHILVEKAMNIYRSSGRFTYLLTGQSGTMSEQQNNNQNREICPSPLPYSSSNDNQAPSRIPALSTTNNSYNQHYTAPSPTANLSMVDNNTLPANPIINEESTNDQVIADDNDENSPIKSASYMDELRQRLERVLNDSSPATPSSSSTKTVPSQIVAVPIERQSCLPISKSLRLPIQSIHSQVQSSAGHRTSAVSRVPLKSSSASSSSTSSSHTSSNNAIQSSSKTIVRAPTSITAPKLKSIPPTQCLTSTENLRTCNSNNNNLNQTIPTSIGSTPLPRKQFPAFQASERTISYRTTHNSNSSAYQCNSTNGNSHQQMSKSFVMPSKRDDHHSNSSLSVASKSDSLNLEDTDLPLPPPTFLENLSDVSNRINKFESNINKSKPTMPNTNININRSKLPPFNTALALKKPTTTFRTNGRPQPSIPVKNAPTAPSLKLSSSISQTRLSKSIVSSTSSNSLANNKSTSTVPIKPVPPVPPRKSSIPRPSFNTPNPPLKPQPPQRDSSTNILSPKAHISHL